MTRIAVALSGGVDSSLCAILLREAGYDVVGVTLRVQHEVDDARTCAGDHAVNKAHEVAEYLGIEHQVCDVCDLFRAQVLHHAWEEYAHGRTPSPCVRCNEYIKFGALLDFAHALGCGQMATGHYVRIAEYGGVKRIARGWDRQKDQSYFLSGLSNETVKSLMFPLGGYLKTEVRALAGQYGLPSAKTPDSQNVCITKPGQTFAETLCESFEGKPVEGSFTMQGKRLAPHMGIHRYTVGQRHGLGNLVPTKISFVKSVGPKDVEITTEPGDLDERGLWADQAVFHVEEMPPCIQAQIRYRSPAAGCRVIRQGGRVEVRFDEPVHAVTPGQIVAFYADDVVIGRAVIGGA